MTRQIILLMALVAIGQAKSAAQEKQPEITTNSINMKLARLPAGEFLMGSTPEEIEALLVKMKKKGVGDWYLASPPSEGPRHKVKLTRPFAIGVTEVTVGQFRQFVDAVRYQTDAERDGKGGFGKTAGKWSQKAEYTWKNLGFDQPDDQAVVNVSWNDAVAFCDWLSKKEGKTYRLPTEAEWEYACRAGSGARYFWGDEDGRLNDHVWHGGNSGGGPKKVASLKPNAWGLFDMNGNVYEYCLDWYSDRPYTAEVAVDPKGPAEGKLKVVRSGSWGTDPMHCRCAFRGSAPADHRNQRDGFRVVLEEK